jgi:hypothetical protein
MKIHLRILLGPDRRYNIISNTAKISIGHFDSILILNTGPDFFVDEMKKLVPSTVEVINHPDFFDIECARRHLLDTVPENDWVLWLDGDETPSPMFLDNMRNLVTECENDNYNTVCLPWYLHMDGNPENEYEHFFEHMASRNQEELNTTTKHYFSPKRFIKNVKNKYIQSNWGAHEYFKFENEKMIYYGYIINHFKSLHDWEQSPVWHLFMNPLVHNLITEDQIKNITTLDIWKDLEKVKIKHNVFTSSEFIEKIIKEDKLFISDFLNLFKELYDIEIDLHDRTDNTNIYRMFLLIKHFIKNYNFKFKLDPKYYCGNMCCKYENHQL